MSRVIGNAGDFYRLRVTRIDETDEPDLEWRDDILYREPPKQRVRESESWALEAVSLDDDDDVTRIALYESSEAAYEALDAIAEDLAELTKSSFEERYLTTAED